MPWNDPYYKSPQWKYLRRQAQKHLPQQCQHCGTTSNLQLDHKTNRAQGGIDTLNNLQWLCKQCHGIKTQHEAQQRRGTYRRKTPPPLGTGTPSHKQKKRTQQQPM